LKIPNNILITAQHPLITEFCQKIASFQNSHKLQHNSNDLCLQLWVSKERKNITNSLFQHFVAFLPITLDNFPILYGNKEMKMIKNSFLADIIESERKYLEEDYKTISEKQPSLLSQITQKEFNQAYELFYSRTYQFTNNGATVTAFVPLVDLFNYKTGESNKVGWKFNETAGQFIIYALNDIKKGSKVTTF